MKKFLLFHLFLFVLSAGNLFSQNWEKVDSVFAVSGVTVKSFSSPFFADVNNDGLADLFIGNLDDKVYFFENRTGGLSPRFSQDDELLAAVYTTSKTNSAYPVLVDLDNDGDMDLVIGGYNGFLYYENIGTLTSPVFTEGDTIFANVNRMIGTDAKPAFADLDGDGDLDLLAGIGESYVGGPEAGITIGFRNVGTPESPRFEKDESLNAGLPDVGYNSYPAFADLDNDGDYDLLIGRDLTSLVYFRNTGNRNAPVWTRDYSLFSGVEGNTYWKNPVFFDLDGDGDFDLIYGTSAGKIYVYLNKGSVSSPSFQYYPDFFKVIKLNGNSATVSLCDYDGDGDYDLLSGIWTGKFIFFENMGNSNSPQFADGKNIDSGIKVGAYSAPVWTDFDKDGDWDILSGALDGKLYYFVNNGGHFSDASALFGAYDVGNMSSPATADLDGDGDEDILLVGEDASQSILLINNGDGTFTQDNTLLNGLDIPSYSRPSFADLDNDGDYDLIFGTISGNIVCFINTGTKEAPEWQRNSLLFNGIKVNQNAHAGFADLNGDGRKDMILADYDGNFVFYKNLFAPVSVDNGTKTIPEGFTLMQNYPNPFGEKINGQNTTTIEYYLPKDIFVKLEIYDVLGRRISILKTGIQNRGFHKVKFNADNLPTGIYFYLLKGGKHTVVRKMMLTK